MTEMYQRLAAYYDRVYATKDYAMEVKRIREIVQSEKKSSGDELLEIACGTGKHAEYLKKSYRVTGLDVSEDMLRIARERNPDVQFVLGDMREVKLEEQFDIVTCLFGSINYNANLAHLQKAMNNLIEHLKPGGVIIIEPIFTKESFINGHLSVDNVDDPDVKIARVGFTREKAGHAILEMQYLIATQDGIVHYVDIHTMGLFTREEILGTMRSPMQKCEIIDPGFGREPLFLGVKHE